MNTEVIFSKKSDEWSTPKDFFQMLNNKYEFCFDLAASKENHKTERYFTQEDNALILNWSGITIGEERIGKSGWLWLNPPYSMCKEFAKKAYEEMLLGAKIIMLVPSRTDRKWFHEFVYKKKGITIEFIKGRLKFGDSKNSAPFPSMLVIFNKDDNSN